MLDLKNAAKESRAQYFCRVKKKKRNSDYGMMKKEYVMSGFINELTVFR
ncbi:hypothetical protein [Citrobacter sedlakii]